MRSSGRRVLPKLSNGSRRQAASAGPGRPEVPVFYFYYMDREFGLMHIRIQAWFPLTVQIAVNGHEWLARSWTGTGSPTASRTTPSWRSPIHSGGEIRRSVRGHKLAAHVDGVGQEGQSAAERSVGGRRVLLGGRSGRVCDGCDVSGQNTLQLVYEQLLGHATLCFSAEDVLKFLGRKPHAGFKGAILTPTAKRKREPGA